MGHTLAKCEDYQSSQYNGAADLNIMWNDISSLSNNCRWGNAHSVIEHIRKKS